jgi:hypothetical protein
MPEKQQAPKPTGYPINYKRDGFSFCIQHLISFQCAPSFQEGRYPEMFGVKCQDAYTVETKPYLYQYSGLRLQTRFGSRGD